MCAARAMLAMQLTRIRIVEKSLYQNDDVVFVGILDYQKWEELLEEQFQEFEGRLSRSRECQQEIYDVSCSVQLVLLFVNEWFNKGEYH
jgi:hypothetical protein